MTNMKIIKKIGKSDLAVIYIAETSKGRIEFIEALEPPIPREEKWVLILSSLYGCPIKCKICDAGGSYNGKLTLEEILSQTDHLISQRYINFDVPVKKFKVQFARIGEPSLNSEVLEALKVMPIRYNAPGLMPCISTIAPSKSKDFFEELIDIKNQFYRNKFQLQFSIHSTDEAERRRLIPIKTWSLKEISKYGERFFNYGDRKITLNFAVSKGHIIDPGVISSLFDSEKFFIKLTPVNPTYNANLNMVECGLKKHEKKLSAKFKKLGFNTLTSIGELEENAIGSNCGQYIKTFENHIKNGTVIKGSYNRKYYMGE